MKQRRSGGVAFVMMGVSFLVIGITNPTMTAFMGVGIVFFIIGLSQMKKEKES